MGHLAEQCRNTRVKQINYIGTVEDRPNLRAIECINTATEKQSNSLLCVEGTVGGIIMNLCFDSGATSSIISKEIVEKYGISIKPSDIKIKVANNTEQDVIGVTDPLVIEINGHSTTLKL